VLSGTFVCFGSVLCDRLDFCQQEPTFGQKKPRASVLAIVAAACFANAFSRFNATVVALGHCDMMILKSLPIPFAVGLFGRGEAQFTHC
jgi:hypothetical protein